MDMDEVNRERMSAPERAAQAAKGYFREGLNCAECVLLSFMDTFDTGMPKDILALATGFGGGVGQTRNMCGAVSGAVMALGIRKGRRDPFAGEETPRERAAQLREIYPCFADLVNEIKERYGSLVCAELSAPYGDFESKARRKNCQEIIAYCARLAAERAEE